jgi:hypothetical protein
VVGTRDDEQRVDALLLLVGDDVLQLPDAGSVDVVLEDEVAGPRGAGGGELVDLGGRDGGAAVTFRPASGAADAALGASRDAARTSSRGRSRRNEMGSSKGRGTGPDGVIGGPGRLL